MNSEREYRQVAFDRKLDVKRLRAALSKTMRGSMKNPLPEATVVRPESIRIERDRTTVFLSGDAGGLEAVAAALRTTFPDARVTPTTREEAERPPAAMTGSSPPGRKSRRPR
jgi:hypothetical protein